MGRDSESLREEVVQSPSHDAVEYDQPPSTRPHSNALDVVDAIAGRREELVHRSPGEEP